MINIKRIAVVFFCIILTFAFVACSNQPQHHTDIIAFEKLPEYTAEQLTEMLKGKTKEELNAVWGEKDAWFTTHPVESWYIEHDDMRSISVYYDENDRVEKVTCGYDPSPSGIPGREIPKLKVHFNGAEAETVLCGYSWSYTDETGQTISEIADSRHPLECTEIIPRLYADKHHYGEWDNYGVTLYFDIEPDEISGCWWPLEQKGNTGAAAQDVLNIYRQQSIVYPRGNNVCQVTASWEGAGTVNYCFILVNDIDNYNEIK